MMTEINPKRRRPPPKPDRKGYLKEVPRITTSMMDNILRAYEKDMKEGKGSEELLAQLSDEYDRSERQICRYLAKARIQREKDRKPNKQFISPDPVLVDARRKHFEELCHLVEQWKGQLVCEISTSLGMLGRYETVFPVNFKAKDARLYGKPNEHWVKGPLHWYIDKDGNIDVWFSVEELPLFRCLKPHLPSKKLWQSFEELKQRLAEGIRRAASAQLRNSIPVSSALSLATEVADELEIALAKRVFAGKCEACP